MNNYISLEVFIENDISGDWGKEFPDEKHKIKAFCVRGADINDLNIGKTENLPVRYVKEASKDKFLEKGNIIIEISGGSPTQSTGRVAFLENIDREVVCSNFCRALKIKKEYSSKYVFYLLQNIYNSGVFFNFESKTSGIKNLLYNSAFENIKVPNRDYSSQQKIENVITVIDKKIQLLYQINDNLAELAKTIYDYWFVQFDFPDQNGKPYKTSGGKMVYNEVLKREIPEGWEVKKLKKYAFIKKGTLITEKQANTNGNIKVVSAGLDFSYYHDKSNFLENTITISASGANAGFINFWREPIFACDCTTVRGNNLTETLYIYQFLKILQDYIYQQAKGSAQPHIYPKDIEDLNIIIPNENEIKKCGEYVNDLNQKILLNLKEIQHLQSLRDWLLPMLMNGQISVE